MLLLVGLVATLAPVGPAASALPTASSPNAPADAALVERDPWTWPTEPPITVVAPFRAPATPYAAGHRGVDLSAGAGQSVLAPAAGVVSFAGMVAGRPVVSLDHGDGIVSSMEPVSTELSAGEAVAEGAPVGTVGEGGHCDGCIHLGVRVDGEYVSPMLFLGGVPRAVLLPLA
jgi:murein DD-endopeptidase MepM/ murein hydrolase activator NlpD